MPQEYFRMKQLKDMAEAQRSLEATIPKMIPMLLAFWIFNVFAEMSFKRMLNNIALIILNGMLLLLFFDIIAWLVNS